MPLGFLRKNVVCENSTVKWNKLESLESKEHVLDLVKNGKDIGDITTLMKVAESSTPDDVIVEEVIQMKTAQLGKAQSNIRTMKKEFYATQNNLCLPSDDQIPHEWGSDGR